jgi:hypothetical protein
MERRTFLSVLGFLAAPLAAEAKQPGKRPGRGSDAQSWPESPQFSRSFAYAGSS